jgi:hypothetical protein
MNYNVLSIPPFDRQLKRLVKKYPSLKIEIAELFDSLEITPRQGTPLGNGCFKIRISIQSKGKGKSGGARVITHLHISDTTVYLLSIYDKSEQDEISEIAVLNLIKNIRT